MGYAPAARTQQQENQMTRTFQRRPVSRILSGLALAGALLTTTATTAAASPGKPADATAAAWAVKAAAPLARADFLMNQTYKQFPAYAQHREAPFDWTTDGCSAPTPWPWSRVFRAACVMHDFGYRNYGNQGSTHLRLDPTEKRRNWIDDRLLVEMNRICDDGRLGLPCKAAAKTIHSAVHLGGRRYFF